MQHEVTSPRDLLDKNGTITEEGWARHPQWRYGRAAIKAGALRIKEWDYYAVLSHGGRFGITMTMSDLGYAGLFAICFLDFERRYYHQVDTLSVLPLGRTGFPPGSDSGSISFGDKKLSLSFSYTSGTGGTGTEASGNTPGTTGMNQASPGDTTGAGGIVRTLTFSAPDMIDADGKRGLSGTIVLEQPETLESMNIATSWAEKRTAFYYNRKINCMPASGGFAIGDRQWLFDPASDFGSLDWGRGNWTYHNRWFWGSASGLVPATGAPATGSPVLAVGAPSTPASAANSPGPRSPSAGTPAPSMVPFGWNIGYGFSDRSPASENAILYGTRMHKLTDVAFHFDESDYMRPWRFDSPDGRFEMDFAPLVDRQARTVLGPIKSFQHQVFGEFSGTATLDDGATVRLDRYLGFAEDVQNWW